MTLPSDTEEWRLAGAADCCPAVGPCHAYACTEAMGILRFRPNTLEATTAETLRAGEPMIEYRPLLVWLLFATLACGTALRTQPAGAHPAAFTLAQIMQAPFPSSLTAAPRGGAVAWVFDAKGRRNIWVADPTGGNEAHAITSFDEDDGSHIDDLAWSPDEASIAFTRGGSIEDDQPANVDSSPSGPKPREVWLASRSGAVARRIGAGHSPSFSPDGTRLLYLDKRQILTAAAGSGAPQP